MITLNELAARTGYSKTPETVLKVSPPRAGALGPSTDAHAFTNKMDRGSRTVALRNRQKGFSKAASRIFPSGSQLNYNTPGRSSTTEAVELPPVEQLVELSRDTLINYMKKSYKQNPRKSSNPLMSAAKWKSRQKGFNLAGQKLLRTGTAKIKAEEQQPPKTMMDVYKEVLEKDYKYDDVFAIEALHKELGN